MLRSIDHIVIVVPELIPAMEDFGRAGFAVIPGGEHADGLTHNALIVLADGSYLELIAFKSQDIPPAHQWAAWHQRGSGLVAFALLSDDLATDAGAWRERGLPVAGPRDGGRQRPDGQTLAWSTVIFAAPDGQAMPLPFVIQDATPRALRVPAESATQHRLPVRRVAGVTVAVRNLALWSRTYADLLGQPGTQGISAHSLRFDIGGQWILLASAGQSESDLGRYVDACGEGIYEVTLAGGPSTTLLLHDARLRIESAQQAKGVGGH
ncbi:MAG TPA: VOC family protein [Ktedonobacterales bacterium]|nr:VOC family protein [Ktedonobacterales bacterium]